MSPSSNMERAFEAARGATGAWKAWTDSRSARAATAIFDMSSAETTGRSTESEPLCCARCGVVQKGRVLRVGGS